MPRPPRRQGCPARRAVARPGRGPPDEATSRRAGCLESSRTARMSGQQRDLCHHEQAVTLDHAPTRRERKKLETRQALEEAALRLFAAQGYEQTTVEEIAEAADVAVRTFFRYFSSKQDVLFGEVATDRVGRLRSELAARPATESPVDSVIAVMEQLDLANVDEEQQILARLDLMRHQPSIRTRYLELID